MILSKQLDDGYFVIPFTVQIDFQMVMAHHFSAPRLMRGTIKVQDFRYGAY